MKSELDIVRKLLAVGDLFDGERKPAGGDIAEIDGRIDELLKFLEGESTKRKGKRDAVRMDSTVDELAGLHELRQMMELASDDGAGDGGEETCEKERRKWKKTTYLRSR